MTDTTEEPPEQVSQWLWATPADLEGLDFETPIAGSDVADSGELADLYRAATRATEEAADGTNDPARARVWHFLWGVTSMHFKPEDSNEPFGAMMVLTDGRRTAIASDFRGHIDMLRTLASAATNVVLRARLSDLAWLLDRKQPAFGVEALKAYVEVVRQTEAGALKYRYSTDDRKFHHETKEYLTRALGLARMLGWSKPEAQAAKDQLMAVRKRAVAARAPVAVHWFGELDLQTRVSEPSEIAAEVEDVLANLPGDIDHHLVVDLWRLAARAYQAGKQEDAKHRCHIAAAEVMVARAEKIPSAMLASHLLANAIAALHGVASARARRLELRHRLVEVQAHVDEEMGSFSQEIDLSELVQRMQDRFERLPVFDGLFLFAALDRSRDPEALRAEAAEMIRKHPLSSLFGTAHLDDEGKVIHRTGGGALGDPDGSVIAQQVAQSESVRRNVLVRGQIDPARQMIISTHFLSDDIFYVLTSQSPFVPQDLAQTFARGFARFFQGDFISALYILTPLLENSLRYVLKGHGHDVMTFDNAGQTQEDRTITALFDGMRAELDAVFTPAITEDIERVFLGRPGPMIRHAVAHGLLHDGSPYGADAIYACWLIFRLCVLPLHPHRADLGLA
jgi:hypothetical protein